MKSKTHDTLGRREFINLPELGVFHIEAKIDTGAYRTVVHCVACREVEQGEKKFLEASFNLEENGGSKILFDNYSQKQVRSSSGHLEMRFVVSTLIRIGQRKIRAHVSLSDRSDLRCQVLIGRRTLKGKYIVDVGNKFLSGL